MQKKPEFQWSFLAPTYWATWFAMGLLYLSIYLPSFVRIGLSKGIAWILFTFWKKRRRIARINIQTCFPQKTALEQRQLLKQHFFSLSLGVFELALAWWANPHWLKKRVTVHGLEHIQKAIAQDKGVLMVSAHFTTIDICGAFASLFFEFGGMYRKAKNPVFDYLMLRGRYRRCPYLFSSKEVKGVIRCLRKKGIIWYAADQNAARREAVFVSFFGETASTSTATARLSKISKALVVPFYGIRRADGQHYDIYFNPALTHYPQGDLVKDTQRINHMLEEWITQAPEQYLWTHQRFRTRPDRAERFYENRF